MNVIPLLRARRPALLDDVRASIGTDGVDEIAVRAAALVELAMFLRDDRDAAYALIDLTVIDRLGRVGDDARFVVIVALASRAHQSRVRLVVDVDDETGAWPSLSSVWPAALLYEREVLDLFGVFAAGHPNPRRLLLPESFVGHPGRSDYRLSKHQAQVPPPERTPDVIIDAGPAAGPEAP